MSLRSMLNPEEQVNRVVGPTKYKKGPNRWELTCAMCGGIYYVDDVTFESVSAAVERGGDNTFHCDICEAEYEELSH